jgi:hypothetical protein
LAYIKVYSHNFEVETGRFNDKTKKPMNRYFQDLCPRLSNGEKCPVCDYGYEKIDDITQRWKTYTDKQKQMFPKTKYYSNILVIDDTNHPENNGKVFLFEYGNGIAKMIEEAAKGKSSADEEENEPPKDIFDPETGYNFILEYELEKGKKWPNLKGKFAKKHSAITNEQEVLSQMVPLQDLVIPKESFNSYDKMKERFDYVINGPKKKDINNPISQQPTQQKEDDEDLDTSFKPSVSNKPIQQKAKVIDDSFSSSKDEDSDMDFLNSLHDE